MARKPKAKQPPGRRPSPEGRVPLNLTVRPGDPERLRVIAKSVGRDSASAAVMWLLDEWEGRAHEILARRDD
jgi:hypothetical protein